MKKCPYCPDDRLMHDSWGCKTKCGCRVSIIYLTNNLFAEPADKDKEQEILNRGKALIAELDRHGEDYISRLIQRSSPDRAASVVSGPQISLHLTQLDGEGGTHGA